MKMETIIVATDFSDASRAALECGCTLAAETSACLLIVHVAAPDVLCGGEELDSMIQPLENSFTQRRLDQAIPHDASVPYEHHLLTGAAADEIVQFARQRSADLIVVGTHGRSGAARLLLGSVAESVVRCASCPVLTVKGTAKEET